MSISTNKLSLKKSIDLEIQIQLITSFLKSSPLKKRIMKLNPSTILEKLNSSLETKNLKYLVSTSMLKSHLKSQTRISFLKVLEPYKPLQF